MPASPTVASVVDAETLLLVRASAGAAHEARASTVLPAVIARNIARLVVAPVVPLSNTHRRLVAAWPR